MSLSTRLWPLPTITTTIQFTESKEIREDHGTVGQPSSNYLNIMDANLGSLSADTTYLREERGYMRVSCT